MSIAASRVVRSDKGTFVHVVRSMPQHTLFAVDFGERADHTSPPSGQEGHRRSTGRELRPLEAIEQGVLAAKLAALAGAISA